MGIFKRIFQTKKTVDLKPFNIGLVLSGGAARGFAHVGILQALQENGISPDIISGVSAGSIVGALYCDGFCPEEIKEIFNRKKLFQFVKICAPKAGFFEMQGLKDALVKNLRSKTFDDLKKPLWVTATNFSTGKPEYFNKGNIVDAVIASSSIPVVFKPQIINNQIFVDGGVTNNFPVEPIENNCNSLIGVYVNPISYIDKQQGLFQTAIRSFQLSIASLAHDKRNKVTIYIEPKKLEEFGLFDMNRGAEIYQAGYEEATKILSVNPLQKISA